ncbi:MAG TPA: FAD-dependent oxidoreductase [Longimicrobiaceae bacterium]|nr:FAD-dependent oxidoreductase [Longimicrobiaceae bacterium]
MNRDVADPERPTASVDVAASAGSGDARQPWRDAVVVGGGVVGLCVAIRLRERGVPVRIVAAEMATDAIRPKRAGEWPPSPASPRAAAVWYPYRAEPPDRVERWAVDTLHELRRISADLAAGVSDIVLTELFAAPAHDEGWHGAVGVERIREGLAEGAVEALRMRVPMIDTPIYLPYLVRRFKTAGGTIERLVVHDLAELRAEGRLVVNCTGLGARQLCGDEAVYPVRGQVLRVEKPSTPHHVVHDTPAGEVTYVFSRSGDCILGGTAEDDVWDETTDDATVDGIRARCAALVPETAGLRILERAVGLRPARHGSVRVEAEEMRGGCLLIHDYGHGGSGFTLSWGCADEVLRLAGVHRLGGGDGTVGR